MNCLWSDYTKKTTQKLVTIISIIMLTFPVCSVWAQVWEGNYKITTGADISILSDYTVVSGNLKIVSSTLGSLSGLENITSVGRNLEILNNTILTSLSGLENIAGMGGNLWIESNDNLINLSALSNITSVGGNLYIINNPGLTSLTGLENIPELGDKLIVYGNDSLTGLSAPSKVTSLDRSLIDKSN